MRVLAIFVLVGCGAREVAPPPDFGPPPAAAWRQIDPIACPEAVLTRFAARVGAPFTIGTEPIVEAQRIDQMPCKTGEPDDACLARARQRPVPDGYAIAGVTIAPDDTRIDARYEVDGRIVTEELPDLATLVTKLKALAADGHKVTVLGTASVAGATARHASIAFQGVGGRQQRVVKLEWRAEDPPRAMGEARAAAEHEGVEIRSMDLDDKGTLVVTATCGA